MPISPSKTKLPPWSRQKLDELAAAKQEIAKLKKALAAGPEGGDPDAMDTDGESGTDEQAKKRIQELAELLKFVAGKTDPLMVAAKVQYEKETADPKRQLAEAKPLGVRLSDIGKQLGKQQKVRDAKAAQPGKIQAQIAKLREQEEQANVELATAESATVELREKQLALQQCVPLPATAMGGSAPASLESAIPVIAMSPENPGKAAGKLRHRGAAGPDGPGGGGTAQAGGPGAQ